MFPFADGPTFAAASQGAIDELSRERGNGELDELADTFSDLISSSLTPQLMLAQKSWDFDVDAERRRVKRERARRSKAEASTEIRAYFGAEWEELPIGVRDKLIQASCGRAEQSAAACLGVIVLYTSAILMLLRFRIGGGGLTLGDVVKTLEAGRLKLKKGCPTAELAGSLRELLRLRNSRLYGQLSGSEEASTSDVNRVQALLFEPINVFATILNCLK